MKSLPGILLLFTTAAMAQIATPTTPTNFGKRGVSGGTSTGDASVTTWAALTM